MNATQAKQTALNSYGQYLNDAFQQIETSSTNGKLSCRMGGEFWSENSDILRYMCNRLREQGYLVKFVHNHCIGSYTEISWN